ncbi:MAG TPA: GGIII-like transmembrane region-containing protein, partial [Terriglobales bacterium]|nr:GGIII-like transmembrane region-containing protein [Terriglobales bacterium]
VSTTPNPMATTSTNPIAPMQPTPTEQTYSADTATYVGVGGLVLALIALVVALTALRKRKTT